MPFFAHDGLSFHYFDREAGIPFFFQHGLGGDVNQPIGLFKPPSGFRLLSFDCRAHGQTRPLGASEKIGLAFFADDLLALMDHLQIQRAIIGGISRRNPGTRNSRGRVGRSHTKSLQLSATATCHFERR